MPDHFSNRETVLEVAFPGRPREFVPVTESPFLIGRGSETGNHLQLDDRRISRRCAAIVTLESGYKIQDLGHRQGIFVNGEKVDRRDLRDGDVIQFGLEDGCEIVFRSPRASAPATATSTARRTATIESMLTRLGSIPSIAAATPAGGLSKLNLLLEATSLLHSQLPLDSVLGSMLDHAISITNADRGLLLEPDSAGTLKLRLARGSKGDNLPTDTISPSQTALRQAIDRQAGVITGDLNLAALDLKSAESIVVQNLRSIVAIPLYAMPRANSDESIVLMRGLLLGALYLDSRRPSAFSDIDRQILDALGVEAASILDNARLVEQERERQRLEQELSIARDIQQALLPRGLNDFPHLAVTGVQYPCHEVGGDYFDVFPLSDNRTAFLIADVSGKGLGAALLTTMLQGALSGMTLGTDPVRVFNHINKFLCEHAKCRPLRNRVLRHPRSRRHTRIHQRRPSLASAAARGQVSDLYTEGSLPVGLLAQAEFTATRVKLEPDDTLVLFSDGIIEAENPGRELFGFDRLHQILSGWQDDSLESVRTIVFDSVNAFSRGAAQSDDMTLLVVRYRTPA